MELDDKLKWLEVRLSSSLRPHNEELKNLFQNDENRLSFHEFVNNEDVRRLFVYTRPPRHIVASLHPPHDLKTKSVFFIKNNTGVKLTKDNMDDEILFLDCMADPLDELDQLTRDVYLPLLCTNDTSTAIPGLHPDKLMDVFHRLMAFVTTAQGHCKGDVTLPLPSIEILAEAASSPNRRGSVLHVLETTVIGWIKQIKGILKQDAIADLATLAGSYPGPLDEMSFWTSHLEKLHSVTAQLSSAIAVDILNNLQHADSTYASSFQNVRKDISKAMVVTQENLLFLSTMMHWFESIHSCLEPPLMLQLFPPLIHTLLLVWSHSKYYHQDLNFHHLLRLISNEVVHRAEAMVGADVLREPLESYSKLKDALRVCAAFRGTYLDYRVKADGVNKKNRQDHAEKMITRPRGSFTLFHTKMYGPLAYTPSYGLDTRVTVEDEEHMREEELWKDSPWPPRNVPAFQLLNSFMERCNDVLELVQTTSHFRLLANAAEIGGAGSRSLDALVREIHSKYSDTMSHFFSQVTNVLAIDGTQAFEKAFFDFRTIVKELESKLADVLRQSFHQCPTIGAQLRLLEVFEGISSRELVQLHLKDKDDILVTFFTKEVIQVRSMFRASQSKPPLHKNMPPVVSRLMWVYALKQRIQGPMNKMKAVSPHSLTGDLGWHLRDAYSETVSDLDSYEMKTINDWMGAISADLTDRLKQPLLIAEEGDEDSSRPPIIHVNLDVKLLLLLREIHYLSQEPFNIKLTGQARELLRNTSSEELRVTATRLETTVSKYSTVMRTMTSYEQPLFDRLLAKIDHLFEEGLNSYTWKTQESADFIELANAIVNVDLHTNLDIVQTNCHEITEITMSWSSGRHDVFSIRDHNRSYSIDELITLQRQLNEDFENLVVPSGHQIHSLLVRSFRAVEISEASPAWQEYVDYIDAIVLNGLKQSSLTSLQSMLKQIVTSNMNQLQDVNTVKDASIPILTIRLELMEKKVALRPPLDESSSQECVQETVQHWLDSFLARGSLVHMLGGKGSYRDYISLDDEVKQLVCHITMMVLQNADECQALCELFHNYAFIWEQDVTHTFAEFLQGKLTPNPLRSVSRMTDGGPGSLRAIASFRSFSRASTKSSIESAGLVGTAERPFLTPKMASEGTTKVPSLDEFDAEIDIYKTARDQVHQLEDHRDIGWLRVDMRPIKHALSTHASKWIWTFTKYLSDQVTSMLTELDSFLKRTEPEIEGITGEERDTTSFMRMMRLFNEVSAQQHKMDGKFAAMHRTVILVKKYGQKLPDATEVLFEAAPHRWNNLRTKVSLAKQRLGPRIQSQSDHITKDLACFADRVSSLYEELEGSVVYSRDCAIRDAWHNIDHILRRLEVLEMEAHDLKELQELLEANIVNFDFLKQCRSDLTNLKELWETVRVIEIKHSDWKRHRWQKVNTRLLRAATGQQLNQLQSLPDDVFTWDVYMGIHSAVTDIQNYLPLIDDLSNSAMRTRHWKQLVRVTGGAVQIDNETLKKMTLGELLNLGLQQHVDDVRAIVQRAIKDLSIEQSLKTYEEVWLSKKFELCEHARNKAMVQSMTSKDQEEANMDASSELSETASQQRGPPPSRGHMRNGSRLSTQSSLTRARKTSISSLPTSLIQVAGQDNGKILLLMNTTQIFDELESHQVSLQAMQSSSAAGSFQDEVLKWQKQLQMIEAVMTVWLDVQRQWTELEEMFSTSDVRTMLSHDANMFISVNRDFALLMKATEKNPNILQCCQRKNILTILEKMAAILEHCRKSLVVYLESRRQKYPRFYFLSIDDVLHIICNGYDLNCVNRYISKLYENVGALVYEEREDGDKKWLNLITAVHSFEGEMIQLSNPVQCEGAIDGWLSAFVVQLQTSLQKQVVTALAAQQPDSKAAVNTAEETTPGTPTKSADKLTSSSGEVMSSENKGNGDDTGNNQFLWTRKHVAEVVYLATQIQFTKQTEDLFAELENGDTDAWQKSTGNMSAAMTAVIAMLKGSQADRTDSMRTNKNNLLNSSENIGEKAAESPDPATRSGSQLTALRSSSALDPATDNNVPPLEMDEDAGQEDRILTSTEPPVDTMNILDMPSDPKKEEGEQLESGELEESDVMESPKQLHLPSHMHKISSLIGLLAHQRDLLQRLQTAQGSPRDSFEWSSQLQYRVSSDTGGVEVKCMDNTFLYGFEYLGSAKREPITPWTERVFLSLTLAIKSFKAGLCMGTPGTGRMTTLCELSHCLGRPLYTVNCSSNLCQQMVNDIIKGAAITGCWLCFNNLTNVQPPVLSVLAQLLQTVLTALSSGKTSVHLNDKDVQLQSDGAYFGIINSSLKASSHDPERLLLFPSVTTTLPPQLLRHFRSVSLHQPDHLAMFNILLISQGILSASEQARKTMVLFDMCHKLMGTNTPIQGGAHKIAFNSIDLPYGLSRDTLQSVAEYAGALLDEFSSKESDNDYDVQRDESEAVVVALRSIVMPRLDERDGSVFATLIKDLWGDVTVTLDRAGRLVKLKSETDVRSDVGVSHDSMLKASYGSMGNHRHKSFRDSLNLNPAAALLHESHTNLVDDAEEDSHTLGKIEDAIAMATSSVGLMPGVAFQARVAQLSQLSLAHNTIIVAGPVGCGKSECIKTFALAERERGKSIAIQSIFTKSMESNELLGHTDKHSRQWKDGLLPTLLRKLCVEEADSSSDSQNIKVLLMDGELDENQFQTMHCILHHTNSIVLANNERIVVPKSVRFIWETESLSQVSPSLLVSVGVLSMSPDDVGWRMMLAAWLERRPEGEYDLLCSLCDQYIETSIQHLDEMTKPPVLATTQPCYVRVTPHQTNENIISTLMTLIEALLAPFGSLGDVDVERYFNFACVWAFGGTLDTTARDHFSQWWRETFDYSVDYPEAATVFDYMVDSDTHKFVKWGDMVPAYSGTPHQGIPPDAFVHTVNTEQILYLLGVLTDYGKDVMLVGGDGCGKSTLVAERIRMVCSGEVAEVLELSLQTNRFTDARLLYERLSERLEWKHGHTYVPKGNKRLLFFVDDLNLAQVDQYHNQVAAEFVRQHIDDGGTYDPDTKSWHYIKNVTYVTTVNPHTRASVPPLSARLMHHFALFNCPNPGITELQSIFSTLTHTHFIVPDLGLVTPAAGHHIDVHDEKLAQSQRAAEKSLRQLLSLIVEVTLELQEKLHTMFLPTANRGHYIFTMRDLSIIFTNLCLSLRPNCSHKSLLLLWEHECEWVYGRRMVNEVDASRYRQAFIRAVRKDFPNDDMIRLMNRREKPVFSNLVEQDSGLVTAGNTFANASSNTSEDDVATDLYRPEYNVEKVRLLMSHGIEEYNKANPTIRLALYTSVIEQVCRLTRVISSPHKVAHSVLIADGCPGRCRIIASLAAHLAGFSIFQINPSPISNSTSYDIAHYKADIVMAYSRAGVKGEKVLFVLEEEDLVDEDFLIYLTDFIVSGSITPLFSYEEQTTIINSIRTEVTQAGLTYTRQVAWQFFLRTVKTNFRVCVISPGDMTGFQRRCREYPSFTKNINFFWFLHWSKRQLIEYAMFHLTDVTWMRAMERENLAHLLATIHLVTRQQDGQEQGTGQYHHLTNFTYEKFVERFIDMAKRHYTEIHATHSHMSQLMRQIQLENSLARRHMKELEHEKVVLDERKMGTVKILSQIGQDTAITEQQIKIVKTQLKKISTLKKLLPEYQVSHERAVYKTVAIVANTKKIVQNMDLSALAELRAMFKPIIEIEELMTPIIVILKGPQSDLTWQKGAKRQMANLERFIEELMTFDDITLPESTLELVEPSLKKNAMDAEFMNGKTRNSACVSLCQWIHGVLRYHRMMVSHVKPLHTKVEQTTQAIDNAEHKMMILENKRKALEVRLADLARGFEEATVDKNDQLEKTVRMDKMLETATRFRKVLNKEERRIHHIINCLPLRESSISGGVAMSAGFATYLGPYQYNFRRLMLTIHWPNCLRERGIPLAIDSIDEVKGRVLDWVIDGLKTTSADSGSVLDEEWDDEDIATDGDAKDDDPALEQTSSDGEEEENEDQEEEEQEEKDEELMEEEEEEEEQMEREEIPKEGKEEVAEDVDNAETREMMQSGLAQITEEEEENGRYEERSDMTDVSIPAVSTPQYNLYMRSLIKLLVGDEMLSRWLKKDLGLRQLENAAIVFSSWQRPAMLIDPNGEGTANLQWLHRSTGGGRLHVLDVDTRADHSVIIQLEKGIMQGWPVLLGNNTDKMDSMLRPIIQHHNTCLRDNAEKDARIIKYCGRRLLCHSKFQLYLATPLAKPEFSPVTASMVTLVNYGSSNETLLDDLLTRSFACVRPDLYKEYRLALQNSDVIKHGLLEIMTFFHSRLDSKPSGGKNLSFHESDVDVISDLIQKTEQMAAKARGTQYILSQLEELKYELFPLAQRAVMLFAILQSLTAVQYEYQFTLPYFLKLFHEAIGAEFTPMAADDSVAEDDCEEESDSAPQDERKSSQPPAPTSTTRGSVSATAYTDDFEKDESTEDSKKDTTDSGSAAENPDAGPVFDMPEIPDMPTDGVEYSGLADNKIKQLIDRLMVLVYQRVQQSLYEKDRLLFSTMLCLNIQEEAAFFMEEELSLLLQGNPGLGMQLSLSDFGSAGKPLDIPSKKWEDILAISVLPGPLDSLCVHMAQCPDQWLVWYKSARPERLALPTIADSDQPDTEREETASPELGALSDFHQLLLLRLLRPDRLPTAMTNYVNRHLSLTTDDTGKLTLEQILDVTRDSHTGVLVLSPPVMADTDVCNVADLTGDVSAVSIICDIAQKQNVSVDVIVMGEGSEETAIDAIHAAEREDTWLVIHQLHLTSDAFFKQLGYHLHRIAKSKNEKKGSNLVVWLVSEPCRRMPLDILHDVYVLSWHSLISLTADGSTEAANQPSPYCSMDQALANAIGAAFDGVTADVWNQMEQKPINRSLLFGVGVIHGLLVARQMFGSRGLSQVYSFTAAHMQQSIEWVQRTTGQDVSGLIEPLTQVVYGNVVCSAHDMTYVGALITYVLTRLAEKETSVLSIGSARIPLPPANVEPQNFGSWFIQKAAEEQEEVGTLQALSLCETVQMDTNNACASEFIRFLDHMYEAQNMESGDTDSASVKQINVLELRAVLDDIVEQLPSLLELGTIPASLSYDKYNFPYHRPSVVSTLSTNSVAMPESVGFVLLQECLWLNSLLSHIRQNVYDLQRCLLSGPDAFPWQLKKIADSLVLGQVPIAWIHPNCQPTTHSLSSWQADLRQRHGQMSGWLKQRMVPIFQGDHITPLSYGQLNQVWLGGLVNPQALLTALMHETAMACGCLVDQMALSCDMLAKAESHDDMGGIVVRGAFLQGADWDGEGQCLTPSRQDVNPLPDLYVKPVPHEETDGPAKFLCPVFMNMARQVCAFHLPMTSGATPAEEWTLAGTAVILDRGVCEKIVKKPGTADIQSSESSRDDMTASRKLRTNIGSRQSTPSQLSYKPLSPQAPSLPPGLQQMQREKPVTEVKPRKPDAPSPSGDDAKKDTSEHKSRRSSSTSRKSVTGARNSAGEIEDFQSRHVEEPQGAAESQQEIVKSTESEEATYLKNGIDETSPKEQGDASGSRSGESRKSTPSSKHLSAGRPSPEQGARQDADKALSKNSSREPSEGKKSPEGQSPANSQRDDDDKGESSSSGSDASSEDAAAEPDEDAKSDASDGSESDASDDNEDVTQPTNDKLE